MLMHHGRTTNTSSVMAIGDTGASHVLIRQSDDHVLAYREYTPPKAIPFGTLNAANGHTLKAIGRGTLHMAGIALPAYVFKDEELTNNLLAGTRPLL